jgi:small-conductance mechanosensitive channel/CRP-like cAMP-binding protein
MQQISSELQRFVWEAGGAFGLAAGILLVLLLVFLPSGRRAAFLRRPLQIYALYLVLVVLSFAATRMAAQTLWLRVAAIAAVLVVLSRASILFATETRIGRSVLPPVPRIIIDVVQGLMLAFVALLTLHAAGFEPTELLATSAILTAVLGLALQDTLGNLFSGLALQVGQHVEVGDWIELDQATQAGRVIEIGWRATKLVTLDEVEIIVPNGNIAKSVIRNHTRPSPIERRNVPFDAAYTVPPGRIRELVLPALAAVPRVLASPPPSLVTASFAESSIHYVLRYYTDDYRGSQVTDSLVRDRIWYALGRAGITMPYPHREIHVVRDSRTQRKEADAAAFAERVATLGRVPVLEVLSESSRARIAAMSREELFTQGEQIVRQGDPGQELYVIVDGEVAVQADDVEIARLGPGGFFGEMSLLTGEPRAATVVALGDVRALAVDPAAIRPDVVGEPDVVARLGTVLAERQIALEVAIEQHRHTPRAGLEERAGRLFERIRAFFPG